MTTEEVFPVPRRLHARDVGDLVLARGYPCVSVLLPTRPAAALTQADRRVLRALVARAHDELEDHGVTRRHQLVGHLEAMAEGLVGRPVDRGVALYASAALQRAVVLPMPVEPRVVVEDTFATRPLVAALHRSPPHLLLVVHPTCAHLYESDARRTVPVAHVDASLDDGPDAGRRLLDGVDRLLAEHRPRHPSPLVLAGSAEVLLDRLVASSRHLERLAGRVVLPPDGGAGRLRAMVAVALQRYLRSRRDEALALVSAAEDGEGRRTVVTGAEACWAQVSRVVPEMLVVEEGYVHPVPPDGRGSSGRHDLVEELMELVIQKGGLVALVDDGDLADRDRVAMVARVGRD